MLKPVVSDPMMKAVVLSVAGASVEIQDVNIPALPDDAFALVRLAAAALNRRDFYITQGLYAKIRYPVIPGSDGCGVVVKGDESWAGREVIINPSLDWGENPKAQGARYSIVGMPTGGTLAEYIAVPANRLHPKPPHLTAIQAAALPLAGVTAFRAVKTQGGAEAGQTALVTGIGGGVALFAVQFAVALGANVFCTSGSDEKIAKTAAMGAAGGANYRNEFWDKQLLEQSGGFDLIIDGAGGEQMNTLLALCKPGGTIVSYGATLGAAKNLNLHRLFWKQIRLQGTTMGTDEDFAAMLAFVEKHRITPVIDAVFPLNDAAEAFRLMERGGQFGKIAVKMEER